MRDDRIIHDLILLAMIVLLIWIISIFVSVIIHEYRKNRYSRYLGYAKNLTGCKTSELFNSYVRLAKDMGYKDIYRYGYKLLEEDYIKLQNHETEN